MTRVDNNSARPARRLRRRLVVVLSVLACLLGLALLPPVQLGVVRWLTRDLGDTQLELDRFSAGPWGLRIGNLRLNSGPLTIGIAEASADLAFWSSLTRLQLDIQSASLQGIAIAHTGTPETEAFAVSDADTVLADRILSVPDLAVWPSRLIVREAKATGSITTIMATDVEVRSRFEFTAANWRRGSSGQAALSGRAEGARADQRIAGLDFDGRLAAGIDSSGRIADLSSSLAMTDTEGTRGLDAELIAALRSDDQRYELTLDSRAGTRLATGSLEADAEAGIAANWELDLPAGIVAAFSLGQTPVELAASSTGRLTLTSDNQAAIQITGSAIATGWDAVDPRLADLGTLTLEVAADAAISNGTITGRTATLNVGSALRGDVLSFDLLQPLSFETGSWLMDPEVWGEPALRVQLNEMPMYWLRQFDTSGHLIDGQLSFSFDMIRDDERVTRLIVNEPLRASQVELAPADDIELPEFSLTLEPQVILANGSLQADINRLEILANTGLAVQFTGSGNTSVDSWPNISLDGELIARVPALTRIVPALEYLRTTAAMQLDFGALSLGISAATAGAYAADEHEILLADFSSQEPLRIDLLAFRPDWDVFEPQSFTVVLDRLPIDWLSPYIPEFELRGGEVSGQLIATTDAGLGLELRAEEPLTVDSLVPVYRGRAIARSITTRVNPTLKLTRASSSLELDELSIVSAGGDNINGRVRIEAAADDDQTAIEIELSGAFPTLAASSGTRIGALRLRQRGAFARTTQRLDVDSLEVELADAGGETLLRIDSLTPFFIDPEPFAVGAAGDPDILRIAFAPLRLEQLLPGVVGLDLEGSLPEGELLGRVTADGGLAFSTNAPLLFRDVSVYWDDAMLLDRVTVSASCDISYAADGFKVRSVGLSALAPDGSRMLELAGEFVAPLSADANWTRAGLRASAWLAPLSSQPGLTGLPAFLTGRADFALSASKSATTSFSLSVTLADATTSELGPLPALALGVAAEGAPGTGMTVTVPLSLRSDTYGASDLQFDGTLERDDAGPDRFEVSVSGSRLAYGDLDRLFALLSPTYTELAPADATLSVADAAEARFSALAKLRTERHAVPFWTNDLQGAATLALERIVFPSFELERLGGRLEIAPDRARLADLTASVFGATFDAGAVIGFDAAADAPYALELQASIEQLQLGSLFSFVAPDKVPVTEGRFDVSAGFTGRGRNPIDLGMSALGTIRLEGTEGVFRGLSDVAGTGSTAARVVGFLTFSRELRAVARLVESIGEIHFDDFELVLARERLERLELEALAVTAPQIGLEASGHLELAPTRPLLLSPLELETRISARGDIAILFDGMELLEPEDRNDEDAWRELRQPIAIGGTPVEPDTMELWALLDQGAENARGSFGVGLRTLNRRLERNEETAGGGQ